MPSRGVTSGVGYKIRAVLALCLSLFNLPFDTVRAQGTAFTYQGRLVENGTPATGTYDLRFTAYDAPANGSPQSFALDVSDTPVTNGLFTVTLNFGPGVFDGTARWLNIAVRPGASSAAYTELSPRQPITATPYALAAGAVTGPIDGSAIVNGSINSAQLAAGAVTAVNLASNSVTAVQLAAGSVNTRSLAGGAVGLNQLATVVTPVFSTVIPNPTTGFHAQFGAAVAPLGVDRIVIGALGDDEAAGDAGAAYLFGTNGTRLATFTNPTPANFDRFGNAVAAVGPDRVMVAAATDDTGAVDAGTVYVFNTNGTLLHSITNPAPANGDWFGYSLAAVGTDQVLIGAAGDDTGAGRTGAAYLFRKDGVLLATFHNPNPVEFDQFGSSVAAMGLDRVLIGAWFGDIGVPNAGVAYLFRTNGALLATFTNPIPANFDQFGISVAAVGADKVIVGAAQGDAGALDAGAAYLFDTNGVLLTTFTKPGPLGADQFGTSVAAVGMDQVLIGAPGDDTGAVDAGAAYLFSVGGALLATLGNPNPAVGDRFGIALTSLGPDKVFIGADSDDLSGPDAGTAYLVSLGAAYLPGLISAGVVDQSITAASLANGAVGSAQIADGSVTAADLSPALGLWSKLGNDLSYSDGNVGIGTGAPLTRLHVKSAGADCEISLESGAVGARRWSLQSTGPSGDPQLSTSFQIIDRTLGARHLLLGSSGNAAIGALANAPGFSAIALGYNVAANGNFSFAIGYDSIANGNSAMALGQSSRAAHNGSFVWADAIGQLFTSTADNQFLIRASGGVGLGTPSPQAPLHVFSANPVTTLRLQSGAAPGAGRIEFLSDPQGSPNEWRPGYIQSTDNGGFTGGLSFVVNGTGADSKFGEVETMRLVNGRVGIGTVTPASALQVIGTVTATAFNPPSDRNLKENFAPVSAREVLEKVATLPISRWNFKGDSGTPHVGPMAQDFHAAFGLGANDTTIATVDADGVALAAIQGLNQKVEMGKQKAETRIAKLEAENAELKQELSEIKQLLVQLSAKGN